jgi:sensor histidine kinase regulating citrate/malate metabolism
MNNIKEGVCAMSEDGDIHFANISALNILGYKSIDESQSKKIFDIAESDFDDFKKEFKEKKKVKAKIITASAKDESPVDVLLTPIFEEDERMVGVIFQGI